MSSTGCCCASTVLIEEPAVIIAAEPALLDEPVRQVGAAVGTLAIDQAERAAKVSIEGKVFAEKAHRLTEVRSNSETAAMGIQ